MACFMGAIRSSPAFTNPGRPTVYSHTIWGNIIPLDSAIGHVTLGILRVSVVISTANPSETCQEWPPTQKALNCLKLNNTCSGPSVICALVLGTGHKLRGEGTTKCENRGSETFCTPPSRQGKTFCNPPPFKGWKHFVAPFDSTAYPLRSCVKTTSTLFERPLQHG